MLELDGRRIGDSTAIIAALEERFPEAPLYPEDPGERRHALELEDFFDEQLGPFIRRLLFHEVRKDRALLAELLPATMPALAGYPRAGVASVRAFTALRFGAADADAAKLARSKVLAALDRLEAELGEDEYLVGDRFTVADLTAAALFLPLVHPPEGPVTPPRLPEKLEAFRAPLAERRGWAWVREMFSRHRGASREEPVATSV